MSIDPKLLEFCRNESQLEKVQAIIKHGSANEAAKALGLNRRTVDKAIEKVKKYAVSRGYDPEHGLVNPVSPGQTVKKVSRFEKTETGHQWVISHADVDDIQTALQEFADGLVEEVRGKAKPRKERRTKYTDDVALYGVGDAHIGMYAWGEETGVADFDTTMACEQIRGAFDYLVDRSPPTEVGIFCNVGDWLHANDSTSLTPASKNLLDTDTRFAFVIPRSSELQKYCIDRMLEKHKTVVVANASGNHDPDASIWVNQVTQAYYHNEPRVQVLNNARKFIHYQFGDVLIIITHGDKINLQRLYEAITRDFRKEMGQAKHIYVITGHVHHKIQQEVGGILFETMNTLAPPDAWHSGSGYGGRREMQCLLMSKASGIKSRNVYNLDCEAA